MKVAIYCRLSEEDRNKQVETDDSESIQNQKSMLIQYAMDRQWEIFNIYSDDDYTGADRNRPSFNQILADAESHKFDIILCKTQSRFTRELEMVEKYIHGLFPLWNIRFVSIVDNADTDVKGNKKSRQINGLVNEWYLEDMSENIKSVLINKRQNGYHIGSFALYGYKKDPEQKGHLIIDEEAAEVVREIFSLFSQGYGKTSIARILNDRGIPNPTEYKQLHGLRYKQSKTKTGTLWKYFAISDMLTNEIYIGNMVQGKYGSVSYKSKKNKPRSKDKWYIVEGTHEAIIERELWGDVQALIKQRVRPFQVGEIGLFARKAKCMYCGYAMRSSKSHNRYYLKCASRHVANEVCIGSFIAVENLEKAVLTELNKISAEHLDKDKIESKVTFANNLLEKKNSLEARTKGYGKKILEYSAGLREIYLDKVKGLISESDYLEFSKGFNQDKEKAESLLLETEKQISEVESKIKLGDNRRQLIENYINLEKLDRQTVEKLIDCIYIGKRDSDTKQIPIEIHWNF